MKRIRRLEPKAREVIRKKLYDMGEVETEEAMELVRPHFLHDARASYERDLRRTTQQIMSSIRDDKGARTTFACDVEGIHKYVNIDASNDVESLRSVDAQLRTKLEGLKISSAKASKRRMEVEGQMSLDLEKIVGGEKNAGSNSENS